MLAITHLFHTNCATDHRSTSLTAPAAVSTITDTATIATAISTTSLNTASSATLLHALILVSIYLSYI